MLEQLFDTLVVPITIYGSEAWGVIKVFNDSDPFEYLHIKFINEMLEIQYKITNVAFQAETKEPVCTQNSALSYKISKPHC